MRAFPQIRRIVTRDLARQGLPKRNVLAALVKLLENTFIRVRNEEYTGENASFSLTTLRNQQRSDPWRNAQIQTPWQKRPESRDYVARQASRTNCVVNAAKYRTALSFNIWTIKAMARFLIPAT